MVAHEMLSKMHKTLNLARRAATPGEAESAWLRTAALAARLQIPLDDIWATDGADLTSAGLWPAVVDAWYDAREGN